MKEMFRRKMKPIQTLLLLSLFPIGLFPQGKANSAIDNLKLYMELNRKEVRMMEYKDNEEALKIKLTQLDVINKSRKRNRVSPVKLDILASRVANRMCREAAENNYVSHWNLAGEKPYHRYAFAGGHDHVSENAFGEWTSGNYSDSNSEISKMMESGHKSFMSERAPNDGHKKNIIDRTHNFVGIGFFASENQFRYYEEFIDRYFDFENIPSELKINESGSITVKTNGSYFLYYLIIYREKFPVALKVAQLKKTGSYQDFSNEEYMKLAAWELALYRHGNTYAIPLKFSREGLYYIQIYLDKKEIKNPSALNTKGKTGGCGIVIRVEK
jgi:uncharacterized protein YkwD